MWQGWLELGWACVLLAWPGSLSCVLVQDEHTIPLEELCARYGTDPERGLPTKKAAETLEADGPNELTPPEATPEWIKFMRQMFGGFATLLWVGSILCFIAWGIEVSRSDDPPPDNVSDMGVST